MFVHHCVPSVLNAGSLKKLSSEKISVGEKGYIYIYIYSLDVKDCGVSEILWTISMFSRKIPFSETVSKR